jgi:molecular chaperone DnaK (HSP70)
VTFDIDENGILNVSAVDKSSGSKGEIRITNDRNRPSAQQIQDMINDSVKHEEKDRQKRRRVEAINRL